MKSKKSGSAAKGGKSLGTRFGYATYAKSSPKVGTKGGKKK